MTYETARTNLLASAGIELAESLLPAPFTLCYSNHSTGRQMRILAKGLTVWQGSVWHSSMYEFNDRGDHPGLQPAFEFARDTIEKYFADIKAAVAARKELRARDEAARAAAAAEQKRAAIESVRQQIATA